MARNRIKAMGPTRGRRKIKKMGMGSGKLRPISSVKRPRG